MFTPGTRVIAVDLPERLASLRHVRGTIVEAANSTVIYVSTLYLVQFDDGSRFVMRDTELLVQRDPSSVLRSVEWTLTRTEHMTDADRVNAAIGLLDDYRQEQGS